MCLSLIDDELCVCLSLIDDELCLCLLATCLFLIVVADSVFILSGCIPTTASHAKRYNTANSSCVKHL